MFETDCFIREYFIAMNFLSECLSFDMRPKIKDVFGLAYCIVGNVGGVKPWQIW